MFDIGGWEFLVIVVLAIVIIGPKDLPGAIRSVTQWVRKARALARDFQSGLDDIARETELDKMEQDLRSSIDADGVKGAANSIRKEIEDAVDPDDEIRNAFTDDDRYYGDPADDIDIDPDDPDEEDIRRLRDERARQPAEGTARDARDDGPAAENTADADDAPGRDGTPPARAGTGS